MAGAAKQVVGQCKKMGISLGTMEFARRLSREEAHSIVKKYIDLGYKELDSALMYWGAEDVLGTFEECQQKTKITHIASKANPSEDFSCAGVQKQLNTSLKSLKVDSVDIFYLHWPDNNIPLEETLKGVNELYTEGKFKEFGLSNYASWEVVDVWHICKRNNYVLPTVYQGMYNALTRRCEDELIPALRKYNIRFYVYNPLAGGILTGKYQFDDVNEKRPTGRFFGYNENWALAYQKRYWKRELFDAVQIINSSLNQEYGGDVGILEASFRWLTHHSILRKDLGDAIIIGVSCLKHVEENIKAIEKGPLEDSVVSAFEEAWSNLNGNIPKYFR